MDTYVSLHAEIFSRIYLYQCWWNLRGTSQPRRTYKHWKLQLEPQKTGVFSCVANENVRDYFFQLIWVHAYVVIEPRSCEFFFHLLEKNTVFRQLVYNGRFPSQSHLSKTDRAKKCRQIYWRNVLRITGLQKLRKTKLFPVKLQVHHIRYQTSRINYCNYS